MLDVIIRGGTVVTPKGPESLDVGIKGGTIAQLSPFGKLDANGAREVDAKGKILIPGGIDPHVHTNWPVPGPGGKRITNAPPPQVSKAALYGGTTTLVDFAVVEPDGSIADSVGTKVNTWSDSYTNYAVHVLLHGGAPTAILEQIPEAISAGYASFKIFTTDVKPARRGLRLKFGDIWELMQVVARHNGLLAVHAEDNDIVMHLYDKYEKAGDLSYKNLPAIHNALSEDLSFRRIIRLSQYVDGSALYMMHVSAKPGVDSIAEARAAGLPVYGETLHNFAAFTAEDYLKPDGVKYHTHPSIKHDQDRERLWSGILERTISTMATDESCTPKAIKLLGQTILDTVGGQVGVETRMAISYTEGVSKRSMSLTDFVSLTSANAARLLGMYPKKGAIAEGSDADIVIWDPSVRRVIDARDLHDSDYSIWEGWEIHGWPAMTILDGKVVVENGELKTTGGCGKHVVRKLSREIQDGPAV